MFNTLPANPFPPSSEQMGTGGGGSYVLPVASADTLGGVKVGNNLSIDNGVLSAPAPYTPPAYSTTETNTGQKWIDEKDIYANVIVLETPTIINASTWYTVGVLSADTIVNVGGIDSDNGFFPFGGSIDNGNLKVLNMRDTAMTMSIFVVYYTKTESEVK